MKIKSLLLARLVLPFAGRAATTNVARPYAWALNHSEQPTSARLLHPDPRRTRAGRIAGVGMVNASVRIDGGAPLYYSVDSGARVNAAINQSKNHWYELQ